MVAITGFGPGLNVITELVCGYILPGKPIANMTFKCYGCMAMHQCLTLLSDLKLGHYMKIPPRSMFVGQFWGTLIGADFNYLTTVLIIDSQREILNGSKEGPTGLWTGQRIDTFWGSGLIYSALGPAKMFALDGKCWFVYIGFFDRTHPPRHPLGPLQKVSSVPVVQIQHLNHCWRHGLLPQRLCHRYFPQYSRLHHLPVLYFPLPQGLVEEVRLHPVSCPRHRCGLH